MADEGYGRDFPGNPNPTPKAPEARSAPAAAPSEETGGVAVAAAPAEEKGARTPARISAVEDGDGFSLYLATDDDPAYAMGRSRGLTGEDAAAVLKTSGAWYNAEARSWEDVPEETAEALLAGRPGFTENIIAKFKGGEASMARSRINAAYLAGKMTREEALARSHEELLKVQLGEQPELVWKGLGQAAADAMWVLSHPVDVIRFQAGELAEQAPLLTGGLAAAAQGATEGAMAGAAAAGVGALTGPVAPAAIISGAMGVGAAYRTWKYFSDTEAGSTAGDLLEKGFDDKTVKTLAPLAGIIKGTMEAASFDVMTAPLKREFITKTLNSAPVKAALSKWYVTYAISVGTEVSTEVAQTRVDQIVQNYAAQIEEKPDLLLKPEEVKNQLWETVVKTVASASGMGVPGAAVDFVALKKQTEVLVEKAAAAKEEVAEAPAPAAAAPAEVAPAQAEAETPAAQGAQDYAGQLTAAVAASEKGTMTDEQLIAQVNAVPPLTFDEKKGQVERKARVAAIESDLSEVQTLINVQTRAKEEFATRGISTKRIDAQLTELEQERASLQIDLDFYKNTPAEKGVVVNEFETLEMKQATLESVSKLAFREGRREVLDTRRKALLDVASRLSLTPSELSGILKKKNYGTMGDREFSNWMETTFKPEAKAATRLRIAREEVASVQMEKEIRHESRIRALNELPSVSKMTEEQLYEYADILNEYEKGDVPLTPGLIKANETGIYKGALTYREVQERAAKASDQPIESLRAAGATSELDIFTPLPHVASKNAHYNFAIQQIDAAKAKFGARFTEFRRELYRLGAAAMASRPRGLRGLISPSMPEVMAWLETDKAKAYAGEVQLPTLTPEEEAFAQYVQAFFDDAYNYLSAVEGLQSRFSGGKYMFHMAKDVTEILAGIPDKGLRAVAKELRERWAASETELTAMDKGKIVGRRKFMTQTLFRSGDRDPSTNVIRAVEVYAKALHNKQALDSAISTIETAVNAAKLTGDIPLDAFTPVDEWLAGYLRTQKGQSIINNVIKQGGKIDAAIRLMSNGISLLYIAGNYQLQAMSAAGETMAMLPAVRAKGLSIGLARLLSKQGQAIVSQKAHFTGLSPVTEAFAPGSTAGDKLGLLMYGIIQTNRHLALQTAFLASLTPEEFNSGVVPESRMAEIKKKLGRWMDLPGNKSLFGSTSTGASLTKFRGWAIPVMLSTADNLRSLAATLGAGDPKRKLTDAQKSELLGQLEALGVAVAVTQLMKGEDDEESPVEKKLLSEIWTLLGALSPKTMLSVGPIIPFVLQLAQNLSLLGTKYQRGEKEGEDRGVAGLKRQFTPALAKQFQSKDEEN
jgi:hypothetical protein